MHTGIFTVARVRGYFSAVLAGLGCALLVVIMPIDMHPVLGRTGIFNHIWPLALSLAGIIPLPLLRYRHLTIDRCSPYRGRRRFLDLGIVLCTIFLCACISSLGTLDFTEVLPGLVVYTLLSSACFPWMQGTAWMPGIGYALLVWLLGTDHFGTAHPWAVTLPSAPPLSPWIACASIAMVFLAAQVVARRPL